MLLRTLPAIAIVVALVLLLAISTFVVISSGVAPIWHAINREWHERTQ